MFGRLLRLNVIKILDLLTFSFFAFLSFDNICLVDVLYPFHFWFYRKEKQMWQ